MKKIKNLFSTGYRNACIGAVGLAVAGGANATLIDATVTESINGAGEDGTNVGKLIIGAVAVVVGVSLVVGLMRKA